MAYKKHPRHITNKQFSKGTTVDGSDIDTALDQMVDHFNRIPKGDLKTRFTPATYVLGWSPQREDVSVTSKLPWMPALNTKTGATVASNSTGTPDVENPQRMKGYAVPGIFSERLENGSANPWLKNGMQYLWTTNVHFKDSVIVDSIYLIMTKDGASATSSPYDASWEWPATLGVADLPPGVSAGDSATDLSMSLHVDHVYKSEDRSLNAVEIMKRNFEVKSQSVRVASTAPTSNMTPAYPGGEIAGHYSKIKVNTPIPSRSRVRFSVCVPDYTNSRFGGTSKYPWQTNPLFRQCYHLVMVVLEEVK